MSGQGLGDKEGDNLDAIHDITVAYPQNIPQTEKHLLNGNFPKEIHFHVQRYPIETVPTSKEELQLWCRKRWEEKEERLRRFYEGGKCFSAAGQGIVPPCKSELRVLAVKCISLLYWTAFPLGMLALLYLYSFAQWYFAAMVVFFVVQQKIFGGLELIELACHRYFKKQQKFHGTKTKSN
ncbi:lysocardiolipin acyltransferase 1 [Pitangus sulphuratus]|nr:lysocardiolipin acyltransferase 1 [Pitangus sulphuratus]